MLRHEWFRDIDNDASAPLRSSLRVDDWKSEIVRSALRIAVLSLPFYSAKRLALYRLWLDADQLPLRNDDAEWTAARDLLKEYPRIESYVIYPEPQSAVAEPLDDAPHTPPVFLNGTSPPIHKLNEEVPIVLARPPAEYAPFDSPWVTEPPPAASGSPLDAPHQLAAADLYLRFFCHMVHGENGPFFIANRRSDVTDELHDPRAQPRSAAAEDAEEHSPGEVVAPEIDPNDMYSQHTPVLADKLGRFRTERGQEREWVVATRVLYHAHLFETIFAVRHESESPAEGKPDLAQRIGMVEMLEDEVLGRIAGASSALRHQIPGVPLLTWFVYGSPDRLGAWTDRAFTLEGIPEDEALGADEFLARLIRGEHVTDCHVTEKIRISTMGDKYKIPYPVVVQKVTFHEAVDFSTARFRGSVYFKECTFRDSLVFRAAEVNGSFTLDACKGEPRGQIGVNLSDMDVRAAVMIEDCEL